MGGAFQSMDALQRFAGWFQKRAGQGDAECEGEEHGKSAHGGSIVLRSLTRVRDPRFLPPAHAAGNALEVDRARHLGPGRVRSDELETHARGH